MTARRPEDRRSIARIAALSRHAKSDGRAATARARAAFNTRFDREVDPDLVLAIAERQRRAAIAKRLYFQRLALKSAQKRRLRLNPLAVLRLRTQVHVAQQAVRRVAAQPGGVEPVHQPAAIIHDR